MKALDCERAVMALRRRCRARPASERGRPLCVDVDLLALHTTHAKLATMAADLMTLAEVLSLTQRYHAQQNHGAHAYEQGNCTRSLMHVHGK